MVGAVAANVLVAAAAHVAFILDELVLDELVLDEFAADALALFAARSPAAAARLHGEGPTLVALAVAALVALAVAAGPTLVALVGVVVVDVFVI